MTSNDRLSIGPAVPGAALRALAVLVATAAGLALHASGGWILVLLAAALVGAALPMLGMNWFAAAIIVCALLTQHPDPTRTAVTIAAVHLLHVLGSLALVVPLRARMSLRALAPTGIRFLWMQALTQLLALGLVAIPRADDVALAAVAGAVAAAMLIAGGVWSWHRRRLHAFSRRSPATDAELSAMR